MYSVQLESIDWRRDVLGYPSRRCAFQKKAQNSLKEVKFDDHQAIF
jgi:hypothetical protein